MRVGARWRVSWRTAVVLSALCVHVAVLGAVALQASPQAPAAAQAMPARTGAEIYRTTCAACHGLDGKGRPRPTVGFDAALPDLTWCAFSTAESTKDWHAVVHRGGPVRGLDRHMPAFGDTLSPEEIDLVVGYARTFCENPSWPLGDLNFPRAFFTEKAFPENETVWTTNIVTGEERSVGNTLVYEHRLGPRSQFELVAPLDFNRNESGSWTKGIGDVAVAFRHAWLANARSGSIAAAGGEVIFPSGNAAEGLGNGFFVYEPFAMFGQRLPRKSYFQIHAGLEIPSDSGAAPKEAYVRTAIGTTFASDAGFGRSWSPQVEVLWARPFGEGSEWDIVPQLQVTLSKIQHVRVAGGVRIPLNERDSRSTQLLVYFLWDWFDGGLFEFWK